MAYSGGVGPEISPAVAPVAGTKILLRRSGVQGKLPTAGDAEYGELFINYHSGDPMLCFKDNADNIVEIKPPRAIDGGGGEVPPDTGNQIGDLVWDGTHLQVWDGVAWQAVGPGSLAYVQKADGGTITNTAGDGCDIPLVNNLQAGLMAPGDKNKLDGYPATPGEISGTLDLQAVTDIGNATTNGATFGDGKISIGAPGHFFAKNDGNSSYFWANWTGPNSKKGIHVSDSDDVTAAKATIAEDGSATFAAGNITLYANGRYVSNVTDADTTVDGVTFQNVANFGGDGTYLQFTGKNSPNVSLIGVSNTGGTFGIFSNISGQKTSTVMFPNAGGLQVGNDLTNNSPSIALNADGSATFASGDIRLNTVPTGANLIVRDDNDTVSPLLDLYKGGFIPGTNRVAAIFNDGSASFSGNVLAGDETGAYTRFDATGNVKAVRPNDQAGATVFTAGIASSIQNVRIFANGDAHFAGNVTSDGTIGFSAPADTAIPSLAGKQIDLVKTIELMAAKLAELGGVDVASLFVAEDPAPITQPADPAGDAGA